MDPSWDIDSKFMILLRIVLGRSVGHHFYFLIIFWLDPMGMNSHEHHNIRHLPRPASDVRRSIAAAGLRRAAWATPWAPPSTAAGRPDHTPGPWYQVKTIGKPQENGNFTMKTMGKPQENGDFTMKTMGKPHKNCDFYVSRKMGFNGMIKGCIAFDWGVYNSISLWFMILTTSEKTMFCGKCWEISGIG